MDEAIALHKKVTSLEKKIRNLRKKIARLESYDLSSNLQADQLVALERLPSHKLKLVNSLQDLEALNQEVLVLHESKSKDLVVVNYLNERLYSAVQKFFDLRRSLAKLNQAIEILESIPEELASLEV